MGATRRPNAAGLPVGRRVLILVVVTAAFLVLIAAATGDRGYLEMLRRRVAHEDLAKQVSALKAENETLLAEIAALKRDPLVIEKLAREKLGYARPGEVIYLLPPKPETQAP